MYTYESGEGEEEDIFQESFQNKLKFSSALRSANIRHSSRSTALRWAAVFDGSSLKRLLVEVCDLTFLIQGVLTVSKNPRCKVGGRLDVTFADEICEVAETKATYITDKLFLSTNKSKVLFEKW